MAAAVCVPGCSRASGRRITCAGLLEEMLEPYAQTYLPENRVDDDRFPSYFGTGTEDYFGSSFWIGTPE